MMQTKYDIGQEVLVRGKIDGIIIDDKGVRYDIRVPVKDEGGSYYTHRLSGDRIYPMLQEKKEKVDHPDHYNQPGKKECIEQMLEYFGDGITAIFCYTNAYKYLYRAGCKDGELKEDDLAKARWYVDYAKKNCGLFIGVGRISGYVKEELEKYENSQSRI